MPPTRNESAKHALLITNKVILSNTPTQLTKRAYVSILGAEQHSVYREFSDPG